MEARTSTADLWDGRYRNTGSAKVSWAQLEPEPSLSLVLSAEPDAHAAVVDVGGGASRLTDRLVAAGRTDITVVDMSSLALAEAEARLAEASATRDAGVTGGDSGARATAMQITRICADVRTWQPGRAFRVWHDRATYHFLTDPVEQAAYWATVRASVPPGGHVVVGTFAEDGPVACSGLPVQRYSAAALAAAMGAGFEVEHSLRHVHTTPAGSEQAFT
jgi:hypothetical protein